MKQKGYYIARRMYNTVSLWLSMMKYKCLLYGYIYDPEKGDPDSGVKPGTPFESLPDGWFCPVCGAAKSYFAAVG